MFATWVMRGLGVLLLVAAGLKLHGLAGGPVSRMGFFSRPEIQVAIVEFEIALGIWLLSTKRAFGAWLTAFFAFASFAGFSLYQGFIGQTSCGCFGRLSLSPWYAFTLDLIILAALFVGRPDLRAATANWKLNTRRAAFQAIPLVVGTAIVTAILFSVAQADFGSLAAALAHFRGERFSVEPSLVDLGEGLPAEVRTVSIEVTNWTDRPIRLIGGTADCSCTVLGALPLTIPAMASRFASVDIRFSGKPGRFTRRAAILIDDGHFSHVSFSLTGRILATESLQPQTNDRTMGSHGQLLDQICCVVALLSSGPLLNEGRRE